MPQIAPMLETGYGAYQFIQGQKAKKGLERPEYEIPEEIKANLSQAELMALEGLPAQQKQEYIENIGRATATGLRGLKTRKAGLAGVEGLAQTETDAYKQLLGMDVAAKRQNIQNLMSQRETMAGFKERQFDINKMQPYLQKYGEAQAMIGAGAQNIMAGAKSIDQEIQQGTEVLTKFATGGLL